MIRKLKAKGFTSTSYDSDILEGEFNGRDVTISIVTNKNKVYRIMVMDKRPSDEGQIKIRYNALYRQFLDNDKYVRAIDSDSLLSDEEDIEYEITINNKQYAATFCQKPDKAEIESQQENSLMRHMEKTMSDPEAEDDLKKGAELLAGILYSRNKVWFTIAYFKGKYESPPTSFTNFFAALTALIFLRTKSSISLWVKVPGCATKYLYILSHF